MRRVKRYQTGGQVSGESAGLMSGVDGTLLPGYQAPMLPAAPAYGGPPGLPESAGIPPWQQAVMEGNTGFPGSTVEQLYPGSTGYDQDLGDWNEYAYNTKPITFGENSNWESGLPIWGYNPFAGLLGQPNNYISSDTDSKVVLNPVSGLYEDRDGNPITTLTEDDENLDFSKAKIKYASPYGDIYEDPRYDVSIPRIRDGKLVRYDTESGSWKDQESNVYEPPSGTQFTQYGEAAEQERLAGLFWGNPWAGNDVRIEGGKYVQYANGGLVRGYANGGLVDPRAELMGKLEAMDAPAEEPMPNGYSDEDMQEIVAATEAAIRGEIENPEEVIRNFIAIFGEEEFLRLKALVLGEGNGQIAGGGDGMSDSIPASIDGSEPAALSDGEFVVPADVVSGLGNGSTEAGSRAMADMIERVRAAKTGSVGQPPAVNQGIMAG